MGSQTAQHVYDEGEAEFPLIELSEENMKPGSEAWVTTRDAVRGALENHGGFLLVFDQIGQNLSQSIFTHSKQFFDLPTHTKMQPTSHKANHGYFGQLPNAPLFESVAIDDPLSIQQCHHFTNIMWPQGNDAFCENVNAFARGLVEVERTVKRIVFESYGVRKENCESLVESTEYVMRLYKYRAPKEDESDMGMGWHRDKSMITILHQSTQGLVIQNKHDQCIMIHSSPSLFCVLAGEGFVGWSNDRISACRHQVMMKSKVPRYSVGLLSYATKLIQPAEELVDEQHPQRYKPFSHYQFLNFALSDEGMKCYDTALKSFCGI